MDNRIVNFKCCIEKQLFISEKYKIYQVNVDNNIYQDIKKNNNGKYSIVGDFQSLIPNITYDVKAKLEINKKYGIQYKVEDIKTDKPTNIETAKNFLYEVITHNQTDILLEVYPNIIDKIIKNDLSDIDLNKTKGIKEATFNKIKDKVIENFALIEVVDLFKGAISMSMVKKLYDNYSSVNRIKKEIQNNPYKALCNISRIGFKTADEIILAIEHLNDFKFQETNLINSKQRMRACLEFLLSENESSGHTKISIMELRKRCKELTPQCIKYFVDVIKETNSNIYVNNDTKFISTKKAYDTEKYIAQSLNFMINNSKSWDINYELYRNCDNGMLLTDEQMESLKNMCQYNISILTAPAGSGKSASIKNMITMLMDNSKSFMLCTPTGKSSKVLSEYTGQDSGTIHRKLEYNPKNKDNPWTYNLQNKLDIDVVIVDEFSMVDIYLMRHLVDAIDLGRTKLVLVFDSFQLASVGCGNIAQDLLTSKIIPTTILTKIFRYNEGGLMQAVTQIRNGEEFLDSKFTGVKIFGTKKDFIFNEVQQTQLSKQIVTIYNKILKDGYNIQDVMLLSSQNKGDYGTKSINRIIQYYMQKGKNNRFLMRGDEKFYLGDKVIQIMNNYQAKGEYGEHLEIFNGNTGIIVNINWESITVNYGDRLIVYDKTELGQIELGYCITSHKSQGDSAKQVIVIAPKSHTYMLTSNLLYVACTRAKERVYLLGNIVTINRAIKKKENLSRNTWLQDYDMLIS